jgi:hypothetical protein
VVGVRHGRLRPKQPPRVLLVAFCVAALAVAPASATELPPTPDPLPGSSFQGGDGDQDDASPLVDWQELQAAGAVEHSPDPNAQDNAFKGGSKENEPGDWDFSAEAGGVNPGKANIRDAWSAVRQPDGNTFLYLGFTREEEDGTTFLTFELNTDGRLWDNGRARVPCRRTGDVLISYEAQGNSVDVVIQRWVTLSTDPTTGCAETGRLDEYTRFAPNVNAQGAINDAAIASRLPGAYGGTIPEARFGEAALDLARLLAEGLGDDCLSFRSVWMHSRSSTSESSNMQDYVAPRPLAVRTCSASGTKFFDRDADGIRDPGEPGIPRFLVFADYDEDGRLDRGEPRTVTDRRGRYVLHDIRPPDGTYRLRETLLRRPSATPALIVDWTCSYPIDGTPGGSGSAPNGRFPCAWGPLDVGLVPDAGGRDFGNWVPARLTLRKEIEPAGDAGRFDLLVNGTVVVPAAGDGARTTISVPPGTYDISEAGAAGTDAGAYRSTVECRRDSTQRGGVRFGAAFEDLALAAGDRATCTFRNIRPGSPAVAIRKVGPASAEAGDALRYAFLVTNPGDVSFPAADVAVSDPDCEEAPALLRKLDGSGADDSPDTLDPGDTWVYRCFRRTVDTGDACEPSRVVNTGTVSAGTNGGTVQDADSTSTVLTCPDQPAPPPPEPPGPDGPEPGTVAPPGPPPPEAGEVGAARFAFRGAGRRCITNRAPRLSFSGARIRRVRVYVNGELRRDLSMSTLERRATPRVTLPPGRYRVTARLAFQRGAGTPPVTLSRVIRTCAAAPPRFTG